MPVAELRCIDDDEWGRMDAEEARACLDEMRDGEDPYDEEEGLWYGDGE